MALPRPQHINLKDWKTRVIIGYVVIIFLFVVTTSWILFVSATNALNEQRNSELQTYAHSAAVTLEEATKQTTGIYSADKQLKAEFASCLDKLSESTPYALEVKNNEGETLAYSALGSASYSQQQNNQSWTESFNPWNEQNPDSASMSEGASTAQDSEIIEGLPSETQWYSASDTFAVNGETYTVVVYEAETSANEYLIAIQTFGLGILLCALFLASLISYWCYSSALASAERVERMLASFMANSSHEMKTPVASIKLLADSISIAADRGKTETVKEFAERINQVSSHLEKLIRDMLSITRSNISSGNIMIATRQQQENSCKADAILNQVYAIQEPIAHQKGLSLTLHIDEGAEGTYVRLSSQDFIVVASNLASNAINYTQEGEITITAYKQRGFFVLKVSDTGCGISLSDQTRIFERFYRVDAMRVNHPHGTGLGLSLVNSIVSGSGGTLSVQSEEGVGSVFSAKIPLASNASASHEEER